MGPVSGFFLNGLKFKKKSVKTTKFCSENVQNNWLISNIFQLWLLKCNPIGGKISLFWFIHQLQTSVFSVL